MWDIYDDDDSFEKMAKAKVGMTMMRRTHNSESLPPVQQLTCSIYLPRSLTSMKSPLHDVCEHTHKYFLSVDMILAMSDHLSASTW